MAENERGRRDNGGSRDGQRGEPRDDRARGGRDNRSGGSPDARSGGGARGAGSGSGDGRAGGSRDGRSGGSRDGRGGGSRDGRGDRSRGPQGGRSNPRPERAPRAERATPPGLEAKGPDPELPEGLDTRDLPRGVKAELRGLPVDLSDKVGPRLLAAGLLIDEDPELAYAHAMVARRMASRLPVVRAAAAETAYAVGQYGVALSEYRALRRMSGGDEYLPVMADCERALGRPHEALKLAKEAARLRLEPDMVIEMAIVEAGARADLDQRAESIRLLQREIERTKSNRAVPDGSKARLRYAYADQLLAHGDEAAARQWFVAAQRLDREGVTDAEDRIAQLDGLVIHFEDVEEDEADESDTAESDTAESDTAEPDAGQSGDAGEASREDADPSDGKSS